MSEREKVAVKKVPKSETRELALLRLKELAMKVPELEDVGKTALRVGSGVWREMAKVIDGAGNLKDDDLNEEVCRLTNLEAVSMWLSEMGKTPLEKASVEKQQLYCEMREMHGIPSINSLELARVVCLVNMRMNPWRVFLDELGWKMADQGRSKQWAAALEQLKRRLVVYTGEVRELMTAGLTGLLGGVQERLLRTADEMERPEPWMADRLGGELRMSAPVRPGRNSERPERRIELRDRLEYRIAVPGGEWNW
jgi:hypothetical protein